MNWQEPVCTGLHDLGLDLSRPCLTSGHLLLWSVALSTARQTALAWRSRLGAVQAVCNGPPMSAAQGTTVYDRLLRLHLWHRSSAAPTVRRLPSAACAATPLFDVRSSGLFCDQPAAWNSLPDYLGDPTRSVDSFHRDLKTLLFRFTSIHSASGASLLCAILIYYWHSQWTDRTLRQHSFDLTRHMWFSLNGVHDLKALVQVD